jgi:AraC family transcriptional activator of pobA
MKERRSVAQLYDPRQNREAIRLLRLSNTSAIEPARTNYFSIYWMGLHHGEFCADAARHGFDAGSLLFFKPYQYIRILPVSGERAEAVLIQFHANFLCIETFHADSGCASELFNDAYHPPAVTFKKRGLKETVAIIEQMEGEFRTRSLAFEEMLLAQLKVLLIIATRQKVQMTGACGGKSMAARHPAIEPLRQLIDENFSKLHAPSDYARLLHLTPKALGRIVREQLGKSLTDLIRERILTHAKWQLLHTLKSVKEVAREVGFTDELYFSRLFKKATGYSPTFFREFETEIRGGSNLSMVSHPAPILPRRSKADNSSS